MGKCEKHKINIKQGGFTLVELLIVVSIISALTLAGMAGYNNMLTRTRAARIAKDFKTIKAAWLQYVTDIGGVCTYEDDWGTTNTSAPCHDEVPFSQTGLYQTESKPGWDGPYIQSPIVDPWGNEYAYDNDKDTLLDYVPGKPGSKHGGVNIQLQWCNGAGAEPGNGNGGLYIKTAPYIDTIIDGGDGSEEGMFRWDTDYRVGGYSFSLAPDGGTSCPN